MNLFPESPDRIMGMKVIIDPELDGVPHMKVSPAFAALMPPEFVADLQAWMADFFGREDLMYCVQRDTLILGPKSYAKLKAAA